MSTDPGNDVVNDGGDATQNGVVVGTTPASSSSAAAPAPSEDSSAGGAAAAAPSGDSGASVAAAAAPSDDSGIDAAILAVLPEDAPQGHDAWAAVKHQFEQKWPCSLFYFGKTKERLRFQTTVANCGGSQEVCARLTRACYLRFDQGDAVEEVKAFRDDVYKQIKEAMKDPASDKKGKKKPDETALKRKRSVDEEVKEAVKKDVTEEIKKEEVKEEIKEEIKEEEVKEEVKKEEAESKPNATAGGAKRSCTVGLDKANKVAHFKWREPGDDQKIQRFTVSINASGGEEQARQFANLLAVHCEQGMSREDMAKVRDEIYATLKQDPNDLDGALRVAESGAAGAAGAALAASKRTATPATKAEQPAAKVAKVEKVEKVAKVEKTEPSVSTETSPREDMPEGHIAWDRVRYSEGKRNCVFKLDGQVVQTTVLNCKGSQSHAMRIARLCFGKLEGGASRQEVIAYRDSLYRELDNVVIKPDADATPLNPNAEVKKRVKKEDASKDKGKKQKKEKGEKGEKNGSSTDHDAIIAQLQKEGRLAGSVVVQGRSNDKKNASINGIYAPLSGGFEGSGAFEKMRAGAPRILFYHAAKSRWKIGEESGADKAFAWTLDGRVKDGGIPTPCDLQEQQWRVFDGKGEGYNPDAAVRCVAVSSEGSVSTATPDSNKQAQGRAQESSNSSSESSSDSDSDSSAAGADAEVKLSIQPVTAAPAAVAAAPPPPVVPVVAPVAAPIVQKVPVEQPPVRGRVCAKMLVRSKLRCGCHFQYIQQCPVRVTAHKLLVAQGGYTS